VELTQTEQRIMGKPNKKEVIETEGILKFYLPEELVSKPSPSSFTVIQETFKNFYFRVQHHQELYKLARNYEDDFKKGVSSFGFYSLDDSQNSSITLIALASHFAHHQKLTPFIVASRASISSYASLLGDFDMVQIELMSDLKLEVMNFSGLHVVDLESLSSNYNHADSAPIISLIESIYKVIFWDIPKLKDLNLNSEKNFISLQYCKNISLILGFRNSHLPKIQNTIDFFKKYSLPIMGFILDNRYIEQGSLDGP